MCSIKLQALDPSYKNITKWEKYQHAYMVLQDK